VTRCRAALAVGSENDRLLEIAVADALFKDAALINPLARLSVTRCRQLRSASFRQKAGQAI